MNNDKVYTNNNTKILKINTIINYGKGEYGVKKQHVPGNAFIKDALEQSKLTEIFLKSKDIII
jgi:hypothetical protein